MRLLGIDLGGTTTRAVLCDDDGALLGMGIAAGGNPRSSVGRTDVNVAAAVRAAVGPANPDAVAVGAAGAGAAGGEELREAIAKGLRDAGVVAPSVVVDDADIAYRASAPGPAGVLLLAGTGAVATHYDQWLQVRRCDGMGWLLGDEGSGVWLGLRVLRAVAADLDNRGPRTALTPGALRQLGIEGASDSRQALIQATDGLRASQLASFAPLALELADDALAGSLVAEAAKRLTRTAVVAGAVPGASVVLAGGLLCQGALHDLMLDVFPRSVLARHPVVGACALAAERIGVELDRGALRQSLDARGAGQVPSSGGF